MKAKNLQQVDDVTINDPALDQEDSVTQRTFSFELDNLLPKQKAEMEQLLGKYTKIFLPRVQASR